MLRVPELTPTAVAKLAAFADLEKRGQPWKDEPRVPAGQAGGGQWTTDGGGGRGDATAPASIASPVATVEPTKPADRAPRGQPTATLDDGVYHFGADGPRFIPAAIPPEEEPLWSRPGKAPENEYERLYLPAELPGDISAIEDLFPRLESHPFENAPFEFPDQVGVAAYADEIGAPSEALVYAQLKAETKAIDPNYDDLGFFPEGGFASLSQANRADLIDKVLLDRAAAYYKFRDDPSKLQIETLRFLRKAVDKYYVEAVQRSEAGRLPSKIGREVAIGNYVDAFTRRALQRLFDRLRIKYGPGQKALINNRDYGTTQPKKPYRVPDMRIGDVSFDWTLRMKQGTDSQVRGFFAADSRPKGVVIIRPSQLYAHGAYYIPRPPDLYRK
jgi:hypothetical protein